MSLRAELWRLAKAYVSRPNTEALRASARAQLQSVLVTSSIDPAQQLDGTNLEVMSESENIVSDEGAIHWYYLTQIVRTPSGEYFLLKTTDTAPFIRHLSQARAKLLLKDNYKAPPGHAEPSDA
jgi:hypothetical protein